MIQITSNFGEKAIKDAENFRAQFVEFMTNVMANHKPQLTDDEQQKVMEKVVRLVNTEYRAQAWSSIKCGMPCEIDGVYNLTQTVLKWAGRRKQPKYKEPRQKMPFSKNGRVIRDPKGL